MGENNNVDSTGTVDPVTGQPNISGDATGGVADPSAAQAPGNTGTQLPANGQPGATTGDGTPEDETFFDPASIADNPELMKAYKQMQKAFSQKTQSVRDIKQKADAYDAFKSDPHRYMQKFAQELGYTLSRGGQPQNTGQPQNDGDWQPQTWNDVFSRVEEIIIPRIMQQLQPVMGSVADLKKQSIETVLDGSFPDWREYEDQMAEVLSQHPTLVSHPDKLYQLAVPVEVQQSRAMQQALKKLGNKVQGADLSGPGNRKGQSQPEDPHKKRTFAESVEYAKKQLAASGGK